MTKMIPNEFIRIQIGRIGGKEVQFQPGGSKVLKKPTLNYKVPVIRCEL